MQTQSLFNEFLEPAAKVAAPIGPFASVAIEQSIDRALDYAIPAKLIAALTPGQRVRVPLGRGNKSAFGYVLAIHPTTTYPRIKPLLAIDDDRVLIPPRLMELSRWMSRYYCSPLGSVLEAVLPSAVRKKVGLGYSQVVRVAATPEALQELIEKSKARKRRAILARLLQVEPGGAIDLIRLAGEAGATPATVRKLARLGIITITSEVDLETLNRDRSISSAAEQPIQLNEDQQKAFDAMLPRVSGGGFSVNLLLGVTGSGKTEVYLQCIGQVVDRGKQAIVLVPEIALTPQTVRRFTARFASVAVLHSGLTATQRHRYWQQISTGAAQVVVGARSAVFAPAPRLGIIVVDEEHEASYKQDSAPRYHGRDVAIKRAQLEQIPIMLGSATPSLETYYRVIHEAGRRPTPVPTAAVAPAPSPTPAHAPLPTPATPPTPAHTPSLAHAAAPEPVLSLAPAAAPTSGPAPASPYALLSLNRRVRGLQMPHVELIDMKQEARFRRGVNLLSQRLEFLLRTTIDAGRQAILLLNRRGYSNFVYCSSCQAAIQCKYCDATMTYHRSAGIDSPGATTAAGLHTGQLHCHYCLAANPLPAKCPTCNKQLSLFGLGTQRVEEELKRKFPDLRYARVDSDSMHGVKDYEALLGRFAAGEVQVMLGTQMIAKGLDYPNVTLVGVISGDTALALPDFRAAERTFQLITQVAGRAGRGDAAGRVVLQTFLPDDPTIQAAIKQDFVGFARTELVHRREVGLPPFARMARVVLRDEDESHLSRYSEEAAAALADAVAQQGGQVTLKGPMPCAISRISGYHRAQIVLTSATAGPLQAVLQAVRKTGGLSKTDRIAVDVDPVSLL